MTKERGSAAESSTAASERIELKGLYAMMLGVWYPVKLYQYHHSCTSTIIRGKRLGHARRLIRARQWAARVGHPFA